MKNEKLDKNIIAKCPKCNNDAILTQKNDPDKNILKCLHCGYYINSGIEFFLPLQEVNEWRIAMGLKPIDKLVELNDKLKKYL